MALSLIEPMFPTPGLDHNLLINLIIKLLRHAFLFKQTKQQILQEKKHLQDKNPVAEHLFLLVIRY